MECVRSALFYSEALRIGMLYALSLCIVSNVNAIVIVVHGTFASKNRWHQPSGQFFQTLKQKAQLLNHNIVSFRWSGGITNKARIQAAGELALFLLQYAHEPEIIIIGHSHGGNVALLASKIVDSTEEIPPFEYLQDIDLFAQWCYTVDQEKRYNKKQSIKIKTLYLLATPIHILQSQPNLSVVGNVYNCYSRGDFIQPVAGWYKRRLDNDSDRIANIEVSFVDAWHGRRTPNHTDMHHPLIAEWILSLDTLLEKQRSHTCHHIELLLDENQAPKTQPIPKRAHQRAHRILPKKDISGTLMTYNTSRTSS